MTSLKSKELQTPEAMVLLYIINIALKNQLALRKQTLPLHVLVLVYPLFSILSRTDRKSFSHSRLSNASDPWKGHSEHLVTEHRVIGVNISLVTV